MLVSGSERANWWFSSLRSTKFLGVDTNIKIGRVNMHVMVRLVHYAAIKFMPSFRRKARNVPVARGFFHQLYILFDIELMFTSMSHVFAHLISSRYFSSNAREPDPIIPGTAGQFLFSEIPMEGGINFVMESRCRLTS